MCVGYNRVIQKIENLWLYLQDCEYAREEKDKKIMWIEADVARLESKVATYKEDNHQQDMLASNFETCVRINKEQGETISKLQDQINQGNVDADAVEGGKCDCKNQDDFIVKLQMGIKEFADQRDKCQEMLSEVIECEEAPCAISESLHFCYFSIIKIISIAWCRSPEWRSPLCHFRIPTLLLLQHH